MNFDSYLLETSSQEQYGCGINANSEAKLFYEYDWREVRLHSISTPRFHRNTDEQRNAYMWEFAKRREAVAIYGLHPYLDKNTYLLPA